MKKKKCRLFSKRLIALLMSLLTVISVFALPMTVLADGDLSEIGGASRIDIVVETHYGHELHYTKVGGTSYPLFCIEYGATSPSTSVLAGRKEMASSRAVEAAKWIYAGYYMEHGNSIDELDMAYCQKKVWAIMGDNVSWTFSDSGYQNWCDNAERNMEKIQTKPSFNNTSIGTIRAGKSKTITDTNGVFKDYEDFSFYDDSKKIKFEHKKNSNDLVITVDKTCEKTEFEIKNSKFYKLGTGDDDDLLVYYPYGNSDYQKLIYSAYFDPVSFYIDGAVEPLGHLEIKKTSEDGKKSFKFNVKGSEVNTTITTDSNGNATLKYIPKGSYTVTEISEDPYVENKPQTKTVNPGQTTTFSFYNTLKKFRITAVKEDRDLSIAQGDATLQGAVYGLYNNGKLVKEYTTDKDGKFTTSYEICGNNWTLKEIKPSQGYLLDETEYKVPAGAKNFSVEFNTVNQTVIEEVIQGKISIIKHSDPCDKQIETPEKGAEFQVYLKKAGSYQNAKPTERDILVTDEDGFAQTKDLPYGVYTVHQTKGLDGTKYVPDYDVFIETDGMDYKFLLSNPPFSSYIKVVKQDIETGKPIVSSSAGYQIYDPSGKLVTMRFTYPTPTTIDTFYTNSEGYLITPEKLPYGKGYQLVEVQAPFGYLLDSTPTLFDVTQPDSAEEDELIVIPVAQGNPAQKGSIEISKTGEMFATVENNEEVYTPKFEEQGLPDAEFEIYAAEDIITGDGTVRAEQGALVDTIVTDSDGVAKSQPLYLGQYIVKETKAPNTFVLDETEHTAVLSYAGQDVASTSTSLSLYNPRQTADISLKKVLEQNESYSVGMNKEIENVSFGLYSTELITAQDESQIPADGLITSSYCDGDGNINFNCDLPIGFNWYVKEIETDNHYLLSDTKYDFSTEYQGQDTSVINIKINDENEIVNDLKYGELHGKKLDDSGEPLADAVIGIFMTDTEKFTADTAVKTDISADDGTFSFLNIPLGTYIVKEITAPKDYLIDPNNYIVEVTENEQVLTLDIVNVLKRGDIQGTKLDDSGNKLEGALIGLFTSDTKEFTEETALMTEISAANGSFSFKKIPVGTYIVKEITAPENYLIDPNNYVIDLTDNNQIITLEIVNVLKRGEIQGIKLDDKGNALADAVIGLFTADTKEFTEETALMTATTAQDGSFVFKDIPVGDYIVKELKSPEGYLINDKKFKVSITENEQIVKLEIINTAEKVKKLLSPLTGAENAPSFILLLCVAGAVFTVSAIAAKRKREYR